MCCSQFFEQYIASIQLNTLPISWSTEDLAYLLKAGPPIGLVVNETRYTGQLTPLMRG